MYDTVRNNDAHVGTSPKIDVVAGVLIVSVGLVIVFVSRNYEFGSTASIGPGYLPRLLGYLLILFGAASTIVALNTSAAERFASWRDILRIAAACVAIASYPVMVGLFGRTGQTGLDHAVLVLVGLALLLNRPAFFIFAGLAAFALTLKVLGLFLATILTVTLTMLAVPDFRPRDYLLMTIGLATLCTLMFVAGLGLAISAFPNGVQLPGLGW